MGKRPAQLDRLLEEALELRLSASSTQIGTPSFDTVNHESFMKWRTKTASYLNSLLGDDNPYVKTFKSKVTGAFLAHLDTGIILLKAMIEEYYETDKQ